MRIPLPSAAYAPPARHLAGPLGQPHDADSGEGTGDGSVEAVAFCRGLIVALPLGLALWASGSAVL